MSGAHRARKRFGQHFLRNAGVVSDIIAAIAPRAADTIVEIGPGRGAITGALARAAGRLHTIEFDRDLVPKLRRRFADNKQVTVHEADALHFDFSELGRDLRIVGNLPYNISTPLLFHLATQRGVIRDMHFMLQKEVVDRMAAEPGSKAYGRLTVMLGTCLAVVPLFDVPPEAFDPPPKVISSVVRLAPLPAGQYRIDDRAGLAQIVTQAFSQRRKTVRNALKQVAGENALAAAGIDPDSRPETVSVTAWIALANALSGR